MHEDQYLKDCVGLNSEFSKTDKVQFILLGLIVISCL